MASRTTQIADELTISNVRQMLADRNTSKDNPLSWEAAGKLFGVDARTFRDFLVTADPEEKIFDGMPGYVWQMATAKRPGRPRKAVAPTLVPAIATPAPAPVEKAVVPVLGSEGAPVTLPVDFENPEAGRRELDASKGERVVSEDNMRDLLKGTAKTKETPVSGWINDGGPTHFLEYEEGKRPNPGHTLLPEPDSIPEPPEGVNANAWELAHAAKTLKGRIWWGNYVAEQMKAHALATLAQEEEEETEEDESDWTPPINPLTGEPYPF